MPMPVLVYHGTLVHTALHRSNLTSVLNDAIRSPPSSAVSTETQLFARCEITAVCLRHCAPWCPTSQIRYIWSRTTYLARDETHAVADVHLSSWRLSNAVKYTPQPNLLTPLMGARDGFVKAALSATLPNDPFGEKIPLGAVRSSVTRIDVLIHHFDDSCCEWHDLLSESDSDDEANS